MVNPKYTFLLPAFKGCYLDEMLRSIQGQTYTDFKVIISDDCSPEDLLSICQPYLADPRFEYRRNEKNMGGLSLVSHWNLLVSLCDTEWLIIASDDDVYDLRFLEEVDSLIGRYPQIDIARAKMCYTSMEGVLTCTDMILNEYESQLEFIHDNYCNYRLTCIANYVFRTRRLNEIGGFTDFPLAWGADQATCMQMAANGCVNTQRTLLKFRLSGLNITTQKSAYIATRKIEAVLSLDKWIKNYLDSLPHPTSPEEQYYMRCCIDGTNYGMSIWHLLKFAPLSVLWRIKGELRVRGYWSGSNLLLLLVWKAKNIAVHHLKVRW